VSDTTKSHESQHFYPFGIARVRRVVDCDFRRLFMSTMLLVRMLMAKPNRRRTMTMASSAKGIDANPGISGSR
jgi:hypothetical protein